MLLHVAEFLALVNLHTTMRCLISLRRVYDGRHTILCRNFNIMNARFTRDFEDDIAIYHSARLFELPKNDNDFEGMPLHDTRST